MGPFLCTRQYLPRIGTKCITKVRMTSKSLWSESCTNQTRSHPRLGCSWGLRSGFSIERFKTPRWLTHFFAFVYLTFFSILRQGHKKWRTRPHLPPRLTGRANEKTRRADLIAGHDCTSGDARQTRHEKQTQGTDSAEGDTRRPRKQIPRQGDETRHKHESQKFEGMPRVFHDSMGPNLVYILCLRFGLWFLLHVYKHWVGHRALVELGLVFPKVFVQTVLGGDALAAGEGHHDARCPPRTRWLIVFRSLVWATVHA